MSSNTQPPRENPVLTAYESFVRDTPLVTRYILTSLAGSWFFSFFVNPRFALSTTPYFCVFKFEVYRIIFSPLVCDNFLSLVIAFLCFVDNGKRLEFSLGSTAFAWYMLTLALVTNTAFIALMFVLHEATGDKAYLFSRASGIWTILFGIIATECVEAHTIHPERRLFVLTVPTLYYPLALWALFVLVGRLDLGELISVGVGYAYGYGYLDKLKVGQARFNQWEDTILANFTRWEGWVVGHAAMGHDAWNNSASAPSGFSFFQQSSSQQAQEGSSQEGTSRFSSPTPADPSPTFPASGGRALGGARSSGTSPRRVAASDARVAMLEAAERRAKPGKNSNNDDNV